jgi:CubicO group peptidase (beta-lactamase class C family)
MKTILIVAYTLLLNLVLNAQDRALQFDSVFSSLYSAGKFTGNVLIAENGKPIFQKSYGKAFREKGLDLNNESVFELASVSKQFTAMGIMILKKQGKLNYTDSLRKFFPGLPYHNISIRQLLNHTSGLPDYMDLAEVHWDSTKIMTNAMMIQLLIEKKPPLLFLPGERWEYSNTGYALLGSIIEKASGQSFKDFMAEHIYKPLGMNSTQVYHKRLEKRSIDNYAYGYVKDDSLGYIMADSSAQVASLVYSLDGIFGDGIINSTTTDLLKWDQALYTEKLVSKKMLQEAFSPAPLNNGKTYGYGFGWLLVESKDFGSYMMHSGGWPGYATWIERHPKSNKTIILLANAGAANGQIKTIRNILFGIEEKPLVEIKVDETILLQYTGTYIFDNKDSLKVKLEGGKLMAEGAGQKLHTLYPEAIGHFFRKDKDYKIQFVKDKNGVVSSMVIAREGPSVEAVKIK